MGFYVTFNDISKRRVDSVVIQSDVNSFALASKKPYKYEMKVVVPPCVSRDDGVLENIYKHALELAMKYNLETIDFELLGKDTYIPRLALSIALKTISEFLQDNEINVGLILTSDDLIETNIDLFIKYNTRLSSEYAYIIDEYQQVKEEIQAYKLSMGADMGNRPGTAPKMKKVLTYPNQLPLEGAYKNVIHPSEVPFKEKLFDYISESGESNSSIYNRAGLSRQVFSKILCDEEYMPKKSTIIALCIGLKLDIRKTEDLLNSAGYCLSNSLMFDCVIRSTIAKSEYNINKINIVLNENNCPLLGSCNN